MDPIKDQNQDPFLDLLNPTVHANPFGQNRSGERAYRKAERIVGAVILLTNHMSEKDILKQSSREIAISILPQILALRDEMRSLSSPKMVEVFASIRQLISLLKLMVFSSRISIQNAEVTIGSLEELSTLISLSTRSSLTETVRFSKEDFLDVADEYKGQLKDKRDKKNIKDTTGNVSKMSLTAGTSELTARSQSLITILKNGGELTMPDIAAHMPEYGEKTIQRELNALIQRGVVKRIGEKRWSRYSAP